MDQSENPPIQLHFDEHHRRSRATEALARAIEILLLQHPDSEDLLAANRKITLGKLPVGEYTTLTRKYSN
jgi:hypothetical protein